MSTKCGLENRCHYIFRYFQTGRLVADHRSPQFGCRVAKALSHETIDLSKIVEIVEEDMKPDEHWVRQPIPLHKRVAMAVHQLASSCEFSKTASIFGVSRPSVTAHLRNFCKALVKHVDEFIKMPGEAEAKELARHTQFPQAYAAIDGTHIRINPPKHGHSDFINRKGTASMGFRLFQIAFTGW
uniref:uncharacterized protein LOC120337201 n=1 Tax=Styela clava TaxID=7725 RepID=UPI001939B425|nr:uncharacterized protein LOC120337201 [Styela clava]